LKKNFLNREHPYYLRELFDTDPYKFYEWRKRHVADCMNACDRLKARLTDSKRGEQRVIRGMIRDLKMVIDWLMTLNEPTEKTDWNDKAKWERCISADPAVIRELAGRGKVSPMWDTSKKSKYWESYHVDQFFDMLTDQQREVFEMKYVGCLTEREIAEYIGTSHGNVRNILKAIEKKRKKFVSEFQNSLIL
jgi:RNA polymerase sigma factor (sigma-70 family)